MANDSKVKALLQETILTLCRASIDFKSELRIEGVIGITVDRDRVLLVSLHTTEKPRETFKEKSKDNSVMKLSKRVLDPVQVETSSRGQRAARRAFVDSQSACDMPNDTLSSSRDDIELNTVEGDSVTKLDSIDDNEDDDVDIKPCIDNDSRSFAEDDDDQLPFTGDEADDSCANEVTDDLLCSVQNTSGETILNVLSASNRVKSFKHEDGSGQRRKRRVLKMTAMQPVPQLPFAKRIEAIQLYEKMQSSIKVAQHLGVGKDQIRRILSHKEELLAHAQHDADGRHFSVRKKSLPFLQRVEAIHLYDVLRSTKKVAKHFGVGPTQIRDILKRRQELLSMAGEANEMDCSQP